MRNNVRLGYRCDAAGKDGKEESSKTADVASVNSNFAPWMMDLLAMKVKINHNRCKYLLPSKYISGKN